MNIRDKYECMIIDGDLVEYKGKVYKAFLDKEKLRLENKEETLSLDYPKSGQFNDIELRVKACFNEKDLFEEIENA